MTIAVERHEPTGAILVRPTGDLTVGSKQRIREAMYKALAQAPAAIVVDLAGAATISTEVYAQLLHFNLLASREPAVPLLFHAVDAEVRRRLSQLGHGIRVYPTMAAAIAASQDRRVTHRWRQVVLAGSAPAAAAAEFVAAACAQWRAAHLLVPARLVAADLIQLAGQQSPGEDLYLSLALRAHLLLVTVRDYDPIAALRVSPLRQLELHPTSQARFAEYGAKTTGVFVTTAGRTWWATIG